LRRSAHYGLRPNAPYKLYGQGAASPRSGAQAIARALPLLTDVGAEMTASIRRVVPADFAQWLPLWDGYNKFYGRFGATALPAEVTQTTWARFFDAYEPMHALVAESDGRLVGLAHYIFHRSTIMLGPICYMQDLFTAEAARGKGIGQALIAEVYAQAKIAGATRVYWQTHETNLTAQSLYDRVAERSGFIVYRQQI
jgi:GNAT superfamily N-acetyltransferase